MSVWRLVLREILYRRLNFGLAVLSVLVAVGCLVAVLTVLRLHDLRTDALIAAKEAEAKEKGRKLEDDYRKINLKLGFNIQILPKDQNLADLYADDYAARTMPEEYADRLAKEPLVKINHMLPSLRQRLTWPEQKRTIILEGVRGEVPIAQQTQKKPLLERVPRGGVLVGHELHASLKLRRGDRLTLLGKEFRVQKLLDSTGSKDDITLWINLAEAQALLDKPGQINAILALECNCTATDRLGEVRDEIAKILPDTQVIEKASQALTRAEARNRAAIEARDMLQREKTARASLRRQREEFAAVLVPLVLLGCTVWVGLLALTNVRDRAGEIGILRALGVRSGRVLGLFLSRAVLVGLLGAVLGWAAGSLAGRWWGEQPVASQDPALFESERLLLVMLVAPLLCALASAMPALLAAKRDPAVVLREG
jgi:ABC-type lipoprotein release transport system permease subunit